MTYQISKKRKTTNGKKRLKRVNAVNNAANNVNFVNVNFVNVNVNFANVNFVNINAADMVKYVSWAS